MTRSLIHRLRRAVAAGPQVPRPLHALATPTAPQAEVVTRLRRNIARLEQHGPAGRQPAPRDAPSAVPAACGRPAGRHAPLRPVDNDGLIYRHAYGHGDQLGACTLTPPASERLQRTAHLVGLETGFRPKKALALRDLLFIDTETTGLSRGAGTLAFMIGVAGFWGPEDALVVDQIVVDDPARETIALRRLAAYLERAKVLVSYNGRGFDLPVLKNRAMLNRTELRLDHAHVDLLTTCRRHFRGRLTDCRLPTVERELLHFFREGDLPGAEAPRVYGDFLRTGAFDEMQQLLEHNRHDIASLAALLPLCADHALDPLTWAEDGEELLATAKWLLQGGRRTGAEAELARSDSGHTELARACLHRLLSSCPWDNTRKRGMVTLARHLRRSGDNAAAREVWDRARRQFPDWPTGWVELAKYHEHVDKDLEQALSYARSAPHSHEDDSHKRIERLERRIASARGTPLAAHPRHDAKGQV